MSFLGSISQAAKIVKSTVQKAVQSSSATVQRVANGVSSAIKTASQYVAKVASPVVSVVSKAAKSVGSAASSAASSAYKAVSSVVSKGVSTITNAVKNTASAVTGFIGGAIASSPTVSYSTTPAQIITPTYTVDTMPFNPSAPNTQTPSPTTTYYGGSGYSTPGVPGQASVPSDSMFGSDSGGVSIGDPGSPGTGIAMGEQTPGQAANGLIYGIIAGGALLFLT